MQNGWSYINSEKKILWYKYFVYKLSYSLVVRDKAINEE